MPFLSKVQSTSTFIATTCLIRQHIVVITIGEVSINKSVFKVYAVEEKALS